MRLYLINPSNPLVSIVNTRESRWDRFRVWKPLSLMVLAGLTPPEWEITIIDENIEQPDYQSLPLPDLVGITAFTSQANRAYEVASYYRQSGVPVVMGGIHATMCVDEAVKHVDSVVTGEAESIWPRVLKDVQHNELKHQYTGGHSDTDFIRPARHDLLPMSYAFGSIQTTRGCPLNCSFCSVTTFNGARYRQRPIADVVKEFQSIDEKYVLVVDDNLIGTRPEHIARAKELFRAMIQAKIKKKWVAQVTINFADDKELLSLAAKAGCKGVFIGFESPTPEGLMEVSKKFNIRKERNFRTSVRQIQQHNILVVGSFILGLDIDKPGIGRQIFKVANQYGVDNLNVLFLTPLPGTRLWDRMATEDRITLKSFPEDWEHYTLTFPVARYKHFTLDGIITEMISCDQSFYSLPRILLRVIRNVWKWRQPLVTLLGNIAYRNNLQLNYMAYEEFKSHPGNNQNSMLMHDDLPFTQNQLKKKKKKKKESVLQD